MSEAQMPATEPAWTHGWDEHERAQAQYIARLPLAMKLQWLEEMQQMAIYIMKGSAVTPGKRDFEANASEQQ